MILVLCSGSDPRQARFISPHGSQGDLAVTYIHGGLPTHTRGTTLLKGHIERVMSSVYRSEYQQVISSAHDGMIHVWAPPITPLRDDREEEERGGGGYIQRRQQRATVLSVTDRQALLYPSAGNDSNEDHNSATFVPPILLRNAPSSSSAALQSQVITITTSSYEPSHATPAASVSSSSSNNSSSRAYGGFGAFSASIMPAYTDSYTNSYSTGGRGDRGSGRGHKRPRISGG